MLDYDRFTFVFFLRLSFFFLYDPLSVLCSVSLHCFAYSVYNFTDQCHRVETLIPANKYITLFQFPSATAPVSLRISHGRSPKK